MKMLRMLLFNKIQNTTSLCTNLLTITTIDFIGRENSLLVRAMRGVDTMTMPIFVQYTLNVRSLNLLFPWWVIHTLYITQQLFNWQVKSRDTMACLHVVYV